MRPRSAAISCATLIAALVLGGCGSSDPTQPVAPVRFESAALTSGYKLPALYTCDGKNIHPPLEWGPVPSATSQLVLLVLGLVPTTGKRYSISVEWAVAGINPRLHRLGAGRLPPGANVGSASDGQNTYSICPKRGVSRIYEFALYAARSSLEFSPNFSGISALATFSTTHTQSALGKGTFLALYKRP